MESNKKIIGNVYDEIEVSENDYNTIKSNFNGFYFFRIDTKNKRYLVQALS